MRQANFALAIAAAQAAPLATFARGNRLAGALGAVAWCLAVVLATLAIDGGHGSTGGSMILFGTAAIIALVLRFSTAPRRDRS
jgi:hypothetical protein